VAQRVLITGVAGFIGSHLAEALLARGDEVVGVDCFTDYYDPRIKEANLDACRRHAGFRLVRADLNDAGLDLEALTDGVSLVFHQAAQAGVRASWGREFTVYTRLNVDATQRLLEHCRRQPVERFVYASSSSVYGQAERLPMCETDPTRPYSPYGVTKLAAEHLAQLYHANFGVPTVSLRYFTVYGPRQRPDMAFHRFIEAALDRRPLGVYGDGEQTRDFTFVADAVAANLLAAERGVPGRVYNVGGGSRVTLRHCLETIGELAGGADLEFGDRQDGDVRHTFADTSLISADLGWSPAVTLDEGLRQQFDWHRARRAGAVGAR